MSVSKQASKASIARRRRALLALTVTALLVVPAALSWACGPNRAIQLDRFDYKPGDPITLTGANFEIGADVTVTVNGSPFGGGKADGAGNLRITFNAPSAPGSYTVATFGTDANGQALAGTGGTQSFTVSAAPTTSGGGGGSTSTPGTTRAPAPGGATGTQPGTTTRQTGSNSTSGRERARARERAGSTTGRAFAPSGSGVTGAVNTTEGTIKTAGTTAFAGSVPRKVRAAAAKERTKAAVPSTAKPAPATATGDLWSGFASAKNPSLMPSAADSGVPAGGTGSGAALGLALLGLGALALLGLGGIAAAGRRKGRAPSN